MPTPTVTNEDLVKAYLAAYKANQTITQLAATLGMKYNALYARVKALSDPKPGKNGKTRTPVKLPSLARGAVGRTKVEALNQMIEEALSVPSKTAVVPDEVGA